MKLRQAFTNFIFATNTDGSGKAASYVRALDMLGSCSIACIAYILYNTCDFVCNNEGVQ